MSLETLLKNFGSKKEASKPAPLVEQVKDDNAGTRFDTIDSDSMCGKCGNNFFWRHKNWWFCGRCRKPPVAEFIHDVRNGEFLLRRPKISHAKITDRQPENTEAVETYDSVIVVEGENACPECPCRWVKETPRDDGKVLRTCYTCKAVIPDGRHGTIRTQILPYYLLPFWKWFNDKEV
jgi:hypothetical protein